MWWITHILLAMHPKIRLSFKGLYEAGLEVAMKVQNLVVAFFKHPRPIVSLDARILRGFEYVEDLMFGDGAVAAPLVEEFSTKVSLPRYVGLIRVSTTMIGTVDLLLDTTGTPRNLHAIAVIARENQTAYSTPAVRFLARELKAQAIY